VRSVLFEIGANAEVTVSVDAEIHSGLVYPVKLTAVGVDITVDGTYLESRLFVDGPLGSIEAGWSYQLPRRRLRLTDVAPRIIQQGPTSINTSVTVFVFSEELQPVELGWGARGWPIVARVDTDWP
jgi:hypothetical protein